MVNLSVCLICYNEANKLPNWLASVKVIADEIIAVDSGSRDESITLLRAAGVRVEQRNWTGYADQRNYAASLANGDWILFLDADERPDKELCQAILNFKNSYYLQEKAFELLYKIFFFGRFLRYGGFGSERHLRLYRRGTGYWDIRTVHERLVVKGVVGVLTGGYVEHYSYVIINDYLNRMNRYSIEAANQMYIVGKSTTKQTAWLHAFWSFISRYILRLGFLDGWRGYLIAYLEAFYTFNKYNYLLKKIVSGR